MSLSLREQLLAAGLVSEKKVKQAALEQSQQQYKQGKNKAARQASAGTESNLAAQKALAEKAARDKELNRRKEEKAQRRARAVAMNQLVEQNRIPRVEDESAEFYNFVDGGKIHRIAIIPETRARIVCGELIVARFRGFFALVPKSTADRIREIDANAVLEYKAEPRASDENDPYKDFVVPDDLKW